MRVPLPTREISGQIFAEAVRRLLTEIVTACGGTQCVDVAEKANETTVDDLDETCDKVDSAENTVYTDDGDGGAGTVTVPRGGVIYLLVNVRCTER